MEPFTVPNNGNKYLNSSVSFFIQVLFFMPKFSCTTLVVIILTFDEAITNNS